MLVTGGTSGIGHAIGGGVRGRGCCGDDHRDPRARTADYDVDLSRFAYRPLDTTEVDSIDALVDSLGDLDVLVNNAGANFPGGRDEWEPDAFAAASALNLAGPMRLTTVCRERLAASGLAGGASVVNARVALRVPLGADRAGLRSGQGRGHRARPATWPGAGSPTASGSTPWRPASSTRR